MSLIKRIAKSIKKGKIKVVKSKVKDTDKSVLDIKIPMERSKELNVEIIFENEGEDLTKVVGYINRVYRKRDGA